MAEVIIDDFEDGDITIGATGWSGWVGNTGSFSASGTSPISGSFSGLLTAADVTDQQVNATRSTQTTNTIQCLVRVDDTPGDLVAVIGENENGDEVGRVIFTAAGDIEYVSGAGTTTVSTYSTGTVYRVAIQSDGTDFTAWVDGTQFGPEAVSNSGGSGIEQIVIFNDNDPGAGAAVDATFDNFIDGPQVDTPTLSLDTQSDATSDFSWTNVSNEDGYELYRSSSSPVTTSDTLVDTVGADVTTTSDTSPDRDQVWYYALRATASGEFADSELSNEVQTQEFGDPTISIDDTRADEIDLSVTYPPNAEEIDIYRAEASPVTTGDTLVTTLTTPTNTHTDTGLENGERYFYTAQARDTDGVFTASELAPEADTITTLPAPTIVSTEDTA